MDECLSARLFLCEIEIPSQDSNRPKGRPKSDRLLCPSLHDSACDSTQSPTGRFYGKCWCSHRRLSLPNVDPSNEETTILNARPLWPPCVHFSAIYSPILYCRELTTQLGISRSAPEAVPDTTRSRTRSLMWTISHGEGRLQGTSGGRHSSAADQSN